MCDIYLDEEKLIKELNEINLTKEDFIEVTDANIESLLKHESDDDEYCDDESFSFSVDH
jgi:hypothetical protein